MIKTVRYVAMAGAFLAVVAASSSFAVERRNPPKPKYAAVDKLLQAQCMPCHSAKNHAEKVDLSSFKALVASNVVVAGHPEQSKLVQYVDGTKKPLMPMRKPPLTKAQVQLLKDWIKAGAKS
jgi:ubiquinol-cytochrome c reductase cytochrome b subunit